MFNKNKKGATGNTIWLLIVIVIAVAVMILVLNLVYTSMVKLDLSKQIDEFGDCDKDDVANKFDKCPCTHNGGLDDPKLSGCPLGATTDEAKNDKISCTQFVHVEAEGAEPTFVGECEEDDEEDCVTKCEWLGGQLIDIAESAGKGEAGLWDAELTSFTVQGNALTEEKFEIPAAGAESVKITINPTVNNVGEQNVVKDISAGVYVCNRNKRADCKPAKLASTGKNGDKAWTFSGLTKGESKPLGDQTFVIGAGDFCESSTNKGGCYIKVMVDTEPGLGEKDEVNNEKFFYLSITDKKVSQTSFKEYWAIELVIDDWGSPDAESKVIEQTCGGYIGDSDEWYYECDSEDQSCSEGEFPSKQSGDNFPKEKGCLIVVSNMAGQDDCGFGGMAYGAVIHHNRAKTLSNWRTAFKNTDGSGAENALAYSWKALSEGSLLCGDEGNWLLCSDDEGSNHKVKEVNGKIYNCRERSWEVT